MSRDRGRPLRLELRLDLLDLGFKRVPLLTEVRELTILRAEISDGQAVALVFHLVMLVNCFQLGLLFGDVPDDALYLLHIFLEYVMILDDAPAVLEASMSSRRFCARAR
jgi:hypothetical protein